MRKHMARVDPSLQGGEGVSGTPGVFSQAFCHPNKLHASCGMDKHVTYTQGPHHYHQHATTHHHATPPHNSPQPTTHTRRTLFGSPQSISPETCSLHFFSDWFRLTYLALLCCTPAIFLRFGLFLCVSLICLPHSCVVFLPSLAQCW